MLKSKHLDDLVLNAPIAVEVEENGKTWYAYCYHVKYKDNGVVVLKKAIDVNKKGERIGDTIWDRVTILSGVVKVVRA